MRVTNRESRGVRHGARLLCVLATLALGIPPVNGTERSDGPFKFDSACMRVAGGTADVAIGGRTVHLENRRGEFGERGLLLRRPGGGDAAAVLWTEMSTGKRGQVSLYSLPDGKPLSGTGWFDRPALEADSSGVGFAVTTPLDRLKGAPPHLRVRHLFRLDGATLRAAGRTKPAPATGAQELEWAADELENGQPAAAAAALEKLRAPQDEVDMGTALQLLARAQTALGRGPELTATLGRLQRDFAAEPAADWAREALEFIARRGLATYLQREKSGS